MRKMKLLLTGILCAAILMPSVHLSAVTVNRHSMDSGTESNNNENEENSYLDTKVEEVTTDVTEEIKDVVKVDKIEPADIVFVIDSTGSMAPYIQNVSDNVRVFSSYLEEKGVDVRMAVVEYKDITYDGKDSTIVHTIDGTPWHKSTAELVKTLQIVKSGVSGGGDDPETVIDALGYVADKETLKFRSDAHKFVIVLSDAGFKENNSFGLTEASLVNSLKEQNINTSVITDTFYFDNYKNITGDTGITTNIRSAAFSDDLVKLADVIFKTIEKEVIDYVVKPVTSIKVTCVGGNTIKEGNTAVLNAVILPETADEKRVSWIVEDEKIASIDISANTLECKVTGISEGKTKIIAVSDDGGFTGSYDITVIADGSQESDDNGIAIEISKEDIKVTPSKKTINRKKSFNIKAVLKKEFIKDVGQEEASEIWKSDVDSVTFRSLNSSIASVNENGKVTGRKKGKTIIKTIIVLADGKEFIYKTTVNVK